MTVRRDGPPLKNFDLLGHYEWKFRYARGDYWLTDRTCAEAERDVEREIKRVRGTNQESQGERDARILLFHAGERPWHVAVFADCTPEYVRRLRIGYGLDAEEGFEREEVDDPEVAQLARAVKLSAKGASIRAIALELGIPKSTVHRMLTDLAA